MDRDPADLPMPAPGLKTDIVRVGDAVVCVMAGDVHTGTKALGDEALREALALRPALLAVDLDAVELFTAEGLNILLTLRDAAGTYGVPLVLVSPSRSVRRILDMTGAAELFTIHSTIAEAVAGHQP
ncbi:STAS domain-containing protein [Streptomyces sp. HUAS TT3]|uniref:STAS domain-containing protein n=1 Tax=Streptomyces sp. HUAS TT3 TaxID=3447510 RepID=UPI003F65F3CC